MYQLLKNFPVHILLSSRPRATNLVPQSPLCLITICTPPEKGKGSQYYFYAFVSHISTDGSVINQLRLSEEMNGVQLPSSWSLVGPVLFSLMKHSTITSLDLTNPPASDVRQLAGRGFRVLCL